MVPYGQDMDEGQLTPTGRMGFRWIARSGYSIFGMGRMPGATRMSNDYICLNPKCPPKQKQGFMVVYWQKPGRCKWCRHILKERDEYEKRCRAWCDSQTPMRDAGSEWFKTYLMMRLYELTQTQQKKLFRKHKPFELISILGDAPYQVEKQLHEMIKDVG